LYEHWALGNDWLYKFGKSVIPLLIYTGAFMYKYYVDFSPPQSDPIVMNNVTPEIGPEKGLKKH
jgi:hypothetical protein